MTVAGTGYGDPDAGGVGTGDGNIFSINTDGTGLHNLLSFNGTTGNIPYGDVILSNSTLYGMTLQGGNSDYGNIFSIDTDGTDFENLFLFNGADGRLPQGDLTLSGSTLYGMTAHGGANDKGTVFSLTIQQTPEPSAFALLGVGFVCFGAYVWRKRGSRRSARPELQDDGPPFLSMPSYRTEAQRRAA